jgi:hypothetical protein
MKITSLHRHPGDEGSQRNTWFASYNSAVATQRLRTPTPPNEPAPPVADLEPQIAPEPVQSEPNPAA